MMRLPSLSTRRILKALGVFSVLTAAVLATTGVIGMRLQGAALSHVILLEEAVQNHGTADAAMDNVRTDVLRALQSVSGANKEGERAIQDDLAHHTESVWDAINANLRLDLGPELREACGQIFQGLAPFNDSAAAAVDLALRDPVAGASNYEQFRERFASFETSMDALRTDLDTQLAAAKADGATLARRYEEIIAGAMLGGLLVLVAATAGAVRATDRITAALARSRAKAHHLSLHDGLTGLPNRAMLRERAAEALDQTRRYGLGVAMLCLDLHRFKQINDTLGHAWGDALLRCVADRLRANVRDGDTVARLGSDEFAIIQSSASAGDAGLLAQRLIEVVSAPYELEGHQAVVGASVGVVLASRDVADATDLLKRAEMALDRAKCDGGGAYRFFEPEMDAALQARRVLEADLGAAVAGDGLELHYQPLVELASGATAGFEALVRWRHRDQGLIPPGDFIPLAEETGLIVPIGEWVLHRACADAAGWPGDVSVAVNVSAVQFERPGLVAAVAGALCATGLPACRLELEITETALLMDVEATLATLQDLRQLGVRIAMDDFGTGYSSLSYLRRFPFDKIKIDQCFIRDIETSADCKAIVSAVAGLGVNLGIATTAEGVETLAQLEQLRAEGCNLVQGYLFSRPVPGRDVARLIGTDWTSELGTDALPGRRSPALAPLPAVWQAA